MICRVRSLTQGKGTLILQHFTKCWHHARQRAWTGLINLSFSPLVSSDADSCWQRFPHGIHKLFELSIRHQALFLVIMLEQLILFDNVGIASSPALKHMDVWISVWVIDNWTSTTAVLQIKKSNVLHVQKYVNLMGVFCLWVNNLTCKTCYMLAWSNCHLYLSHLLGYLLGSPVQPNAIQYNTSALNSTVIKFIHFQFSLTLSRRW